MKFGGGGEDMKKIKCTCIVFLIVVIAIGLFVRSKDNIKFKNEYEKNSDIYGELIIQKENPMKYTNAKEAVNLLQSGSGIIYIGFPECPYCRQVVPFLIQAAERANVEEIYYLNINKYNNEFKVENGEVKKAKKEKAGYYELLEELKDITKELWITEGSFRYLVEEKRIASPTVLKVQNGEWKEFDMMTITEIKQNEEKIEEEKQEEIIQKIVDFFQKHLQ